MGQLARSLVLAAAGIASLASGAAPEAGERADNADGCDEPFAFLGCPDAGPSCPVGESCSPVTPTGLYFVGPGAGDGPGAESGDAPLPTAVGGEQTIRVLTGSSFSSPPFLGPFEADSSSAAVFDVLGVAPPTVRIAGVGEGAAKLRIVEVGTGLLFDRIELRAAAVAQIGLIPRRSVGRFDDTEFWKQRPQGFAWLAGSTEEIVVALHDIDNLRLADESMALALGPAELVDATVIGWDTVLAIAPEGGVVTVDATVGAGAHSRQLRVVDSVDEIRWVPSLFQIDPPDQATLRAGTSGDGYRFCFRAQNAGELVAGVDWTFLGFDGLVINMVERGCVFVAAAEPGTKTLVVIAHDRSQPFSLTFTAPPRAKAGDVDDAWHSPLTAECLPGERADMPAAKSLMKVPQ